MSNDAFSLHEQQVIAAVLRGQPVKLACVAADIAPPLEGSALALALESAKLPLAFILRGMEPAAAIAAAGLPGADELLADPAFLAAVKSAAARCEGNALAKLWSEGTGADLRWLLERLRPERYAPAGRRGASDAKVEAAAAETLPGTPLERAAARRARGRPALSVVE
jgi:hypothetical protein